MFIKNLFAQFSVFLKAFSPISLIQIPATNSYDKHVKNDEHIKRKNIQFKNRFLLPKMVFKRNQKKAIGQTNPPL